jgi:hypothetical protein
MNPIRTAIKRPHFTDRGDDGNLVIVMSIILVLVTLSSLLFARILGNNEIIRARQSTFSGVTGADAGLSDALFRIDQGGSDVGTSGVFCLSLNPQNSNCAVTAGASNPQLSGIEYVARTVPAGTAPSAATEWIVQSIGEAQTGLHGAVQETLTRSSKFPFAIFANKQLTISGNSTSNVDFGSYSVNGGFSACSNTVASPPCVYIGSNGPVSCTGPSPVSVVGVFYNSGSGGGSDSCGTAQGKNTAYTNNPQQPPPGTWTCPNGGSLGSGNGYGSIPPGTYVCNAPINVSGTLTVGSCAPAGSCDPNVYLYVMTGSSYQNFMTVAADSQINTSIAYSSLANGSGPPQGSTLPNSQLFQLYSDSSGNLTTNGNSDGFVFGGILYAPNAFLTANGCKSYFFGSVDVNTYTCHGGPNLAFYYDATLQSDYGSWQVTNYQQINPQSVTIPGG